MKIKQTVVTVFFIAASLVAVNLFGGQAVAAETCGGVQTSILSCEENGACTDGEKPYEGTKPSTDDQKSSYESQYGHPYGKCNGGVEPKTVSITDTGAWGILLVAINILTAGIGVVTVAGIVYASILYTSAGGSAEQIKKAMTIIADIVIGVVAYALMYVALNFLIPGGLFN